MDQLVWEHPCSSAVPQPPKAAAVLHSTPVVVLLGVTIVEASYQASHVTKLPGTETGTK